MPRVNRRSPSPAGLRPTASPIGRGEGRRPDNDAYLLNSGTCGADPVPVVGRVVSGNGTRPPGCVDGGIAGMLVIGGGGANGRTGPTSPVPVDGPVAGIDVDGPDGLVVGAGVGGVCAAGAGAGFG